MTITYGKDLCKPYLELLMGGMQNMPTSYSWGEFFCINPHSIEPLHCLHGKDLCKTHAGVNNCYWYCFLTVSKVVNMEAQLHVLMRFMVISI